MRMQTPSFEARVRWESQAALARMVISAAAWLAALLLSGRLPMPQQTAFLVTCAGVFGASLNRFRNRSKLLRDPDGLHRAEVVERDERNRALQAQGAASAFWWTIDLLFAAGIVCIFVRPDLYLFLFTQILLMCLLYLAGVARHARRM